MGLLQDRLKEFTRPQEFMARGIYPYFRQIYGKQGPVVDMDGHKVLMFGSNAYTGLTYDERIIDAACKALHKYGSGCAGSRFLNGTLDLHVQLEKELAEFVGKDESLCFSTGFSVNSNGTFMAYSYRDPSPLKSISIIEDAASYLVNVVKEMDNLDTFIIGTMSNAEPLLSPPTRIRLADSRYFREKTYEERLEAIREILSLKPQNLADYAEGINAALKDGAVCIIGPAEIVEQCEGFTILNSED